MNAVLVVDMLRGFLEKGYPLYCGDKARLIIEPIQKLLAEELSQRSKVYFLCDSHSPDDLEFKMFPPHCVTGSVEAELIPELRSFAGEVVKKNRYSGFYNTGLDYRVRKLRPSKLIICGVLTNICVLHTTADARNRDFPVDIPVNCVASTDEEDHQCALKHMEKVLGAKLTQVK